MSIWSEVKAWWHVYAVPLFKGPQEPEEESAGEGRGCREHPCTCPTASSSDREKLIEGARAVAPQAETPQCGPCRRGQHGCCDGNEYLRCECGHAAPVLPSSGLNGVVGYALRWIELHRENKFQREAAKIMQRVVDALVSVRAERDAALAAIERIREAVSGHPECDRYEEGDVKLTPDGLLAAEEFREWRAAIEREAAARALDEAADDAVAEHNDHGEWWDDANMVYMKPSGWLRARAAEIRGNHGDD